MKILIGICTYCRNAPLLRLLAALEKSLGTCPAGLFGVAVCDNTPDRQAQTVVSAPAVYLSCPTRGIANARNALLDYALAEGYDALLFLDDDEMVEPPFLSAYLAAFQRNEEAAFVAGPVFPVFMDNEKVPPWFAHTSFYRPPERQEGRLPFPSFVGAGNVLICLSFLKSKKMRFDTFFDATGGEDSLFFFEIQKNGGTGVWINNPAFEDVTAERLTASYFLNRSRDTASAGVRAWRRAFGGFSCWRTWLPKALLHLAVGAVFFVAGLFFERFRYKSLRHRAVGWGQLCGLLGVSFTPYTSEAGVKRL